MGLLRAIYNFGEGGKRNGKRERESLEETQQQRRMSTGPLMMTFLQVVKRVIPNISSRCGNANPSLRFIDMFSSLHRSFPMQTRCRMALLFFCKCIRYFFLPRSLSFSDVIRVRVRC